MDKKENKKVEVKKTASKRLIALIAFTIIGSIGVGCFVIYMLNEPGTGNIAFAYAGALMGIVGGAGFYYFYQYGEGGIVEYQGGKVNKEQVNSLCWYPEELKFMDVYEPEGYPRKCHNDGKYYYVNIYDESLNKNKGGLKPFKLPDVQYMEPENLGQRVLDQPAHRKLFRQRESLFTKLRPGLLIIAIFVVGILMVLTTGE